MAQTRKRRRTKHRGNAAGMVEARGRTGRRPTETEKAAGVKETAADRRRRRLEQPPTWTSAFNRAAIGSIIFGVLAFLILDRTVAQATVLAAFLLLLYVPMTYYVDLMMHRRHMRKQEAAKARAAG